MEGGESSEISELVLVVQSESVDLGHTPTFTSQPHRFPKEENLYFGIPAEEIYGEDDLVVPFDSYLILGEEIDSEEGEVRIPGMTEVDPSEIGVARRYQSPHEYNDAKIFEGPAAKAEVERRFGKDHYQQALRRLGIE